MLGNNKPAPKAGRRAGVTAPAVDPLGTIPIDPLAGADPPTSFPDTRAELTSELTSTDLPDFLASTSLKPVIGGAVADHEPQGDKMVSPNFLREDETSSDPRSQTVPTGTLPTEGGKQETAIFQQPDDAQRQVSMKNSIQSLEEELSRLHSESERCETQVNTLRQESIDEQWDNAHYITEHPAIRDMQQEAAQLRRQIEEQRHRRTVSRESLTRAREEFISNIQKEISSSAKETVQTTRQDLSDSVEEIRQEVAVLEEAHAAMIRESSEDAACSVSASTLTSMFGELLKTVRNTVDKKMQSISREEVELSMKSVITGRVEEAARASVERSSALKTFKETRFDAFATFRASRMKSREEMGDKQFAQLKMRRESHLKDIREKTQTNIKEREALLDADIAQVRLAGSQSVDRLASRHKQAMNEEGLAYKEREKELLSRLECTKEHQLRLQEQEKLSLLRRSQQEMLDERTTKGHLVKFDERVSRLNALRDRIHRENTNILHAQASREDASSASTFSFKSSLCRSDTQIAEKQAAVSKIKKHVALQRETTERARAKLNKLSSRLEQQLQSLIAAQSDGRSSVAVAQQKVDLVRSQWEKEHRQTLSTSNLSDPTKRWEFDDTNGLASQDEVLCRVLGKISWQLSELLSKGKRLTETRHQHISRLDFATEAALAKQEDLMRLNADLLGRYDEVAKVVAQVETKEAHLRAEERDLALARDSLVDDVRAFEDEGDTLKVMSSELHAIAERAAIEHQENTDKLAYAQHWHAHHFSSQPRRSGVVGKRRSTSTSVGIREQPKGSMFRSAVALFDDFQSSSEDSALRLLASQPVAESTKHNRQLLGSALGEGFSAGDSQAGTLTTPSPDTN